MPAVRDVHEAILAIWENSFEELEDSYQLAKVALATAWFRNHSTNRITLLARFQRCHAGGQAPLQCMT